MSLMKKSIILIGCMVLGLTSCYKSVLDPLEGKFPAPTQVNATQVTATAEKLDAYHLFSLDLQEGGNAVHLALAGEKYYLPANTYIEAEEAAARKGNFILGKTTVNGTRVRSGKVVVAHTPIDEIKNHYDISAVLFLDNGDPYTLSWSGDLDFYPDPVEGDIVVENTLMEEVSTTEAGTVKHVVTILDADDAVAAYFEFYAAPGTTGLAGTYTCIEYAENDPDGWVVSNGWSFPDWGIAGGSYYMKDGAHVDIQPGQVVCVAALSATAYAISIDGADVIVGGVPGEAIVVPGQASVEASTTEAGTNKYVVNVTDEESGDSAYFELYAPGAAAGFAGSYTCIEYAENDPDGWVVSNGWSFPDWGIAGGSHYVTGGVQTDLAVGDVVNVTPIGEGMYSFAVSSGFSVLVKVQ